jgi:hypothetical protein
MEGFGCQMTHMKWKCLREEEMKEEGEEEEEKEKKKTVELVCLTLNA